MQTNIIGAKCIGINAVPVTVEVDITHGIGIHLVGLADVAVKESLLRIVTALQTLGFRIPGNKIVINLAPADMHKKGSGYDLPIALGILASSEQRDLPLLSKFLIMGELGLDGTVRSVPGSLPMVELAVSMGFQGCILPIGSAMEAAELRGIEIYGVQTLTDALDILGGETNCGHLVIGNARGPHILKPPPQADGNVMDFADIIGQEGAKRGLEIAAAGGHNALLIGPPGAGKSSLARAAANLLPPLALEEAVQTSKIYSVAGKGDFRDGLLRQRPFRNPHNSASVAALIGGGSDNIIPGEISLAHNGVLFMDEFCEVPKKVLESLRGPMEDKKVTVSRLRTKIEYPADFMLIAATNPCPCGYYGEGSRCACTQRQRSAYLSKLSGPIMDRIDIHLWLKPVDATSLVNTNKAEKSADVAARVARARKIQEERFKDWPNFTNASMTRQQIDKFCILDNECKRFLEKMVRRAELSARGFHKILKIARTIADLEVAANPSIWGEEVPEIGLHHLSEAISYRVLDKKDLFV